MLQLHNIRGLSLADKPLMLGICSILISYYLYVRMAMFSVESPFSVYAFVVLSLSSVGIPGIIYYYFYGALRHIPQAKECAILTANEIAPIDCSMIIQAQSSSAWLRKCLKEPKAPDVYRYMNQTPNNGLLRYSGMFGAERVVVTSLEGLREVLQEKSYKFHKSQIAKRIVGPLLGDGILIAEGDVHKVQKKIFGPAFAPRHVKDLYPIFWEKTLDLVSALSRHVEDPEGSPETLVNFSIWAARATLDIISVATFGGDFGTLGNPDSELSKSYHRLFAPRQRRDMRSILAVILPLKILQALPLRRNTLIRTENKTIREFCRQSIKQATEQLVNPEIPTGVNILSVALRSQGFSDDDLVDQLMTFLVAGHETTAQSLSWTIYLLCKHPQVQARLRSEMQACSPSSLVARDHKSETLQPDTLPYLQAVCNESLRLIPVIPIITRQAAETTTILSQPIPAGTVVIMSPWAINRSPLFWGDDAAEFNPDRWLCATTADNNSNLAKTSSSSSPGSNLGFLTFSHGPRACIGQGFARAELAILLAGLVQNFELRLAHSAENTEPEFGFISVKPAGGLMVRMKKIP